MPVWGQVVLSVAAVCGAVVYLWSKVLRPGAQLISTMDRLLPVAKELAEQFHDAPEAFKTLREIAVQFKADSGTSLRDVINRLEVAANENRASAEVLKVNVEAARQLAEQDRQQLAALIAKLDLANSKIDQAVDIRDSIAANLETHLVDEGAGRAAIAADLEASHLRAEAHPVDSESGAAADAAMRRPDETG